MTSAPHRFGFHFPSIHSGGFNAPIVGLSTATITTSPAPCNNRNDVQAATDLHHNRNDVQAGKT